MQGSVILLGKNCLQPHILYLLENDTSVPATRTPSVYGPCLSSLARWQTAHLWEQVRQYFGSHLHGAREEPMPYRLLLKGCLIFHVLKHCTSSPQDKYLYMTFSTRSLQLDIYACYSSPGGPLRKVTKQHVVYRTDNFPSKLKKHHPLIKQDKLAVLKACSTGWFAGDQSSCLNSSSVPTSYLAGYRSNGVLSPAGCSF